MHNIKIHVHKEAREDVSVKSNGVALMHYKQYN